MTKKYIQAFFMRLSLRDRIMFIKQLAVLIRAGIPIVSSLQMLKKQSDKKAFNKIMEQVIYDVENGQGLAAALGKFNTVFGQLSINIIAVGEISGTLSNNLDHLASTLKKTQSLRQKLISASVYPIFIIIATIAITIMLTVFIFPKILPVFKSIRYPLPWTTRFLIFIQSVVKEYGVSIFIGFVVLIIVWSLLLKIKKVRFWYHVILIKTPFINKLIKTYNTAHICRTLGLLLGSAVSVVQAFTITAHTTRNVLYKRELDYISEKITKGETISASLNQEFVLFDAMVPAMIAVGESTGSLGETFLYLADTYEQELDEAAKNLSTAVEPLLLIFMGVLVGFVTISIITPIYGITQHLTPK